MNIKQTLKSHSVWLASNGKMGKRADLSGMSFYKESMRGINLSGAILVNTRFVQCNLNSSNFRNAFAEFADFKRSQLVRADFSGAILTGSNFFKADIARASFDGAEISHCEFSKANTSYCRNSKIKGIDYAKNN